MDEVKDLTLSRVIEELDILMERLKKERANLGQSEKSRLLAIAVTNIETGKLFIKEAEQAE